MTTIGRDLGHSTRARLQTCSIARRHEDYRDVFEKRLALDALASPPLVGQLRRPQSAAMRIAAKPLRRAAARPRAAARVSGQSTVGSLSLWCLPYRSFDLCTRTSAARPAMTNGHVNCFAGGGARSGEARQVGGGAFCCQVTIFFSLTPKRPLTSVAGVMSWVFLSDVLRYSIS